MRIAVQQRHRLFRDGLCDLLGEQPDLRVVGKVETPVQLVAVCEVEAPDVAVLGWENGESPPRPTMRELRQRLPFLRLVVLAAQPEEIDTELSRSLGGLVVRRGDGLACIVDAIRSPLADHGASGRGGPAEKSLTPRERAIISLIGAGWDLLGDRQSAPHQPQDRRQPQAADVRQARRSEPGARGGRRDPARDARSGSVRGRRRSFLKAAGMVGNPLLIAVAGAPGQVTEAVREALAPDAMFVELVEPTGATAVVLVDPTTHHWLMARTAAAPVVAVVGHELTDEQVASSVLWGAEAVLHPAEIETRLRTVVRAVVGGETVLSGTATRVLAQVARAASCRALAALSRREREIAGLIAQGFSVKQTALALGISAKTVENLQGRLFRKLGVRNRAQAAASLAAIRAATPTPHDPMGEIPS